MALDDVLHPAVDERFFNRELSWLAFNHRVLELAGSDSVPVLERAKYLAIFAQNLDEMFQVRVAGLKERVAAGITIVTPDGRSPQHQLLEIRDKAEAMVAEAEGLFTERLVPDLAEVGIVFSSWDELDDDDRKYMVNQFEERIFPVLTPLAVDPGHPFPYISSLSLNLAVTAYDPDHHVDRFARVKVPPAFPRFVVMPDLERFVPMEQVIGEHIGELFPGMEISSHTPFRVTRNADLSLEDQEADDLLAAVETELRRRRFGAAVRLEVSSETPESVRSLLLSELDLTDDDVYEATAPLDMSGLWALYALDRPDLKDEMFTPVTQKRLAPRDDERVNFFTELSRGDILVHHPYDSFGSSVEEFIRQATFDPDVRAIKVTLYRTSGDSPIVHGLIRAAEHGKEVAALVEVKARFDEAANIEWARALEKAGVHVVYGLVGLKTHTKTCLVIREEGDDMKRYCHVGTGNYNSTTARIYEDLGLFTADEDLGADLTQLFNTLTGFGRETGYAKLVQAPTMLRKRIASLIENEAALGTDGRIIAKMNSLVDPDMIEAFYAASEAGVQIDLIVRGICCLRPGVPGMSENIRVRSLVGRYLEHSRIYFFENGAGRNQPVYYIGSADLMPRNLDRRVEALAPVTDPELQLRLHDVLDVNLEDDVLAWGLGGDGEWRKVKTVHGHETHRRLQELATKRVS